MSVTIELPDLWGIFDPDGVCDGALVSAHADGKIIAATAEDAWKSFFAPKETDREREQKAGWTVRGISRDEYLALMKAWKEA